MLPKGAKEKILVWNWKMNPESKKEALTLFSVLKKESSKRTRAQTVLAPPLIFIPFLQKKYRGKKIEFSAQNVFFEKEGSFTGAISPGILKDFKVAYALVGHSERRSYFGTDDQIVEKKIKALLPYDISPIICIGETERDEQGKYLDFLEKQIQTIFSSLDDKDCGKILLAYEPIWAVGRGASRAVSLDELFSSVIFIKKILKKLFGNKSHKIKILYGGSVNSKNIKDFLPLDCLDGFLFGRAGLDQKEIKKIMENF